MYSDPLDWIIGDDTGISSKAIWSRMMGRPASRNGFGNHPHDPDDFGRCYRLLACFPAWRARIGELALESREWARLVAYWDAIEASYVSECPGDPSQRAGQPWNAPLTYDLMKRVIEGKELSHLETL